jgi:hypothetical protein
MKTTILASSLAILALTAACSSSGGGSGGGGATTATTTGTTTATTTTGAGGNCAHAGDATAWAGYTAGPIACQKNSDCCVIINDCISAAQVVGAADKDKAKAAWPYCTDYCNDCIPPAVVVGCDNGVCTGTKVDFADASNDLMQDHCGVDGPTIPTGLLHFSCGG